MFFWNSLVFYMIQWMLAIWTLVTPPFLSPACPSGSWNPEVMVLGRRVFRRYSQESRALRVGSILSPCLFNINAEHIIWNAKLDESQAGIKTARRNTNNLRYADDTTNDRSEEELKSLLMLVKEKSEKFSLRLNIKKLRSWYMAPSLHGN